MEQGPGRLCPRCGTPRVGNFRWCRSCQFDFDADRLAPRPIAPAPPVPEPPPPAPAPEPAFTLPGNDPIRTGPPAAPAPAPSAPVAVTAAASSTARPSPSYRIPRRVRLPLTVAGVVAVVLALALILIPPRSSPPAAVASPSSISPGATAGPSVAGSAAPVAPINVTGTGSEDVPISIAAGTPYLATIINTGQGPFTVWTLGADGAQNEQLVNVTGPFAGTRLFDEEGHSTGFSVASDGSWSIEVNPVSAARSWDLSERLAGDGADVVAVLPPTSADTDTTVRYDGGALVISAHTSAGAVELLRDTGPLEEELVLPSGTSLIEVEADAAWSIAPQ